ncbi:MAG: WecB/TagA/CpsF family glycosyltransferase [Patescibacteria group bacterium]
MLKPLVSLATNQEVLGKKIAESLTDKKFLHIISLNTENAMEAQKNQEFEKIYFDPDSVVIADGIGIVLARNYFGLPKVNRITGVDLMTRLVQTYPNKRILFVGGIDGTAQKVVDYYKRTVSQNGDFDCIADVDRNDTDLIQKITSKNPEILFIAFGSPFQEIWIQKNKSNLKGIVCMGVGGGFDFVSGKVRRAPKIIRDIGLEWLFRLIIEPWRLKRQLVLPRFVLSVVLSR